jgi:hypothetical protein
LEYRTKYDYLDIFPSFYSKGGDWKIHQFVQKLQTLGPDQVSQFEYGSGSRSQFFLLIHADPDLKHCSTDLCPLYAV